MIKLPITRKEQEVWQACDDLIAMGKTAREVTGEAIAVRLRELKYKAGSSTERYKYRDSWMSARGLSKETPAAMSLIDSSDPIARATALFKDGLERELQREYEQKFQQLESRLAEKEAEIFALTESSQITTIELADELRRHQSLREQYALKTADYQQLHEKAIRFQVQIAELEKQITFNQITYDKNLELYQKEQRIAEEQMQGAFSTVKIAMENHIAEIKDMGEQQRHRFILEIDALKVSDVALRVTVAQQETENKLLKAQLVELTPMANKLTEINQFVEAVLQTQVKQTKKLEEAFIFHQQQTSYFSDIQSQLTHIEEKQEKSNTIICTQLAQLQNKSQQLGEESA